MSFPMHDAWRNPSMGTEALGPLLYWLARGSRVCRVLEIGAGYTTVLLAQALHDNLAAFEHDRGAIVAKSATHAPLSMEWSLTEPALADPGFYLRDYRPHLISVDSGQEAAGLPAVRTALEDLGLADCTDLIQEDFRTVIPRLQAAGECFDLIWFDCGGYAECADFMKSAWPLVNPNGGLLGLHYTLTNLAMGSVLRDLKLRQATGGLRDFELLSLLEPHKFSQNSCTLLRRIDGFEERIYSQPDIRMMTDTVALLSAR